MCLKHSNNNFHELTAKNIAKGTICFETKKDAEKVLAVIGMIMKKARLPLMDKDVVGATLAPTLALIVINL